MFILCTRIFSPRRSIDQCTNILKTLPIFPYHDGLGPIKDIEILKVKLLSSFKKYRIIIVLFFFFLKLFHCHLSILKKYTETLSFLMNKANLQIWESLEVVSIFHCYKQYFYHMHPSISLYSCLIFFLG